MCIRDRNQGNRNANDGIALAQTIEGALDETTNMLQRIRTLAVQASNGTNTAKDRKALQEEVTSLCQEITRIGQKTTFAGANVLMSVGAKNGQVPLDTLKNADGEYYFQVGANAQDMITLAMSRGFHLSGIASMAVLTVQKTKNDISKSGLILSNNVVRWVVCQASYAQVTLANIDKMIEAVDSRRAALGAVQNRMESTIRNQSSIAENESDARSRIRDTDFASETAALTQNQIIQQASQTILSQANQRPTVALNLLGGRQEVTNGSVRQH